LPRRKIARIRLEDWIAGGLSTRLVAVGNTYCATSTSVSVPAVTNAPTNPEPPSDDTPEGHFHPFQQGTSTDVQGKIL
jgi:hypothetical protein